MDWGILGMRTVTLGRICLDCIEEGVCGGVIYCFFVCFLMGFFVFFYFGCRICLDLELFFVTYFLYKILTKNAFFNHFSISLK